MAVKIQRYRAGWFHSQSDFGPPVEAKGMIGENRRSTRKVATQSVRSASERYLSRLVAIHMAVLQALVTVATLARSIRPGFDLPQRLRPSQG
jgi:hypothetical protein